MVHPRLLLPAHLPPPLLDPMRCCDAAALRRSESLFSGPRTQPAREEKKDERDAIRRAASLSLHPAVIAAPDIFDLC